MEERNNNQTTTSGRTCMHTEIQPGRTHASITRTESNRSTVSQIYRATQKRVLRPVHRKNHARIPERIERIHRQNVPINV